MSVQVIMRDGAPEYAVLPWDDYQALLAAAGQAAEIARPKSINKPSFSDLARLREARQLSQADLARAVGISPAYLALIETGERDPGDAIRSALARALQVDGWEPQA